MRSLPRLHWSTLGAPTEGCDSAWSSQWEVTVDRAASPSLPPKEVDLWVISADAEWPAPELARLAPEVGALPILLVRKEGTLSAKSLAAWSELGSVRWSLLTMDPPLAGLRPRSGHTTQLTASQALHYGLVAMGAAMQEVMQRARAAAATKATVLLLGESGTGKEVVARAIHRLSAESDGPFVPVHCGAIPENLLESELFGYTKGAFTDARKDTAGKFREAHGGTIFLDEVATMPLSAQVRLLRVLQEREVQPLGGGGPVKVEVRVVAATNAELKTLVADGRFRQDLFYRLEVVPITLPPMRARREEIPFLAQHFMTRKAREHGLYPKALHPSVDPLLMALPWPGNVRQLENAIERAIVLSAKRPVLMREDFAFLLEDGAPVELPAAAAAPATPFLPPPPEESAFDLGPDGLDLNQVVTDLEKKLMLQSLAVTRGNKKRAAELLGLKRTTFLEKMKRLDIQEDGMGPDESESLG